MRRRHHNSPISLATIWPLTLIVITIGSTTVQVTQQLQQVATITSLNSTGTLIYLNRTNDNDDADRGQNTTSSKSEQQQQQLQTTSNSNSTTLIESLNERLVKESNLQAEESRQADGSISVVAAPREFSLPTAGEREQLGGDSKWPEARDSGRKESTFVSGGSGNSYLSMQHDGSNRYEFGFDTAKSSASQLQLDDSAAAPAQQAKRRPGPRLMREESRLADGTVIGRYGYTDPLNVFRIVQYVAGPDGYFASEDVGALSDVSGTSSSSSKFQLNKQLSKALEQASALRRARSLKRAKSTKKKAEERLVAASSQQDPSLAQSGAEVDVKLERRSGEREEEEVLHGSASSANYQSVRYATRINHVLGNNGVTYATAFRPVATRSIEPAAYNAEPSLGLASGQQQMANNEQPPNQHAVYSSMRYEPQLEGGGQLYGHSDQVRSQVPAPIYSPSWPQNGAYSGNHEDSSSATDGGQLEPLSSADNGQHYYQHQPQQQQQVTMSQAVPAAAYSRAGPPPVEVLQSHPAWSVLNNNYNGNYQSSLIIDHSSSSQSPSWPAPNLSLDQVGHKFEANFNREAALLAAIGAANRGASNANAATPIVSEQQSAPIKSPSFSSHHQSFASFGTRRHAPTLVQGQIVASSTQDNSNNNPTYSSANTGQAPSHNYDFALKHFDAPLYSPEVHEIKPDEGNLMLASSSQANAVTQSQEQQQQQQQQPVQVEPIKPIIQYSTTVVHSEVAAEQAYKPERFSSLASDRLVEPASDLQRSSSEVTSSIQEQQQQQQQQQSNQSVNLTQINEQPSSNVRTTIEAPKVGDKPERVLVREPRRKEPAYATRLGGLELSSGRQVLNGAKLASSDDELYMEDSEQVSYLANGTTVTTSTSTNPRARFPDRSKKLSSIFKARQASHNNANNNNNGGDPNHESSARIRRPVPVNAKKASQQQQQSESVRREPDTSSSTSDSPTAINTTQQTQTLPASQISKDDELRKQTDSALSPSPLPHKSNKKFGLHNNQHQQAAAAVGASSSGEPAVVSEKKKNSLFYGEQQVNKINRFKKLIELEAVNLETPAGNVTPSRENPSRSQAEPTGQALSQGVATPNVSSRQNTESNSQSESSTTGEIPTVSKAMIIDTSKGGQVSGAIGGVGGQMSRELLEKIMRIQQELASAGATGGNRAATVKQEVTNSKSDGTSQSEPPAGPDTDTASPMSDKTEPSSTTSTTSEAPQLSPATTTTTTTTTIKPSEPDLVAPENDHHQQVVGQTANASAPVQAAEIEKLPEITTTTSSTTSTTRRPEVDDRGELEVQTKAITTERPNNFLTGPLMKMSMSIGEQEDFMANLVRDMDISFDSARASVMQVDTPSESTKTVAGSGHSNVANSNNWQNYQSSPAGNESSLSTTVPPATAEAPKFDATNQRVLKQDSNNTDSGLSQPTPVSVQSADTVNFSVNNQTLISSNSLQSEVAPDSSTTNILKETAASAPPTPADARDKPSESLQSWTEFNQTVTSTSEPPPPPPQLPTTTTTTTTTTSTTTTERPTTTTTSRVPSTTKGPRPVRRTTAQPARFGRLVIKRGDKVVARYNASDSIPDSMIPVGGGASGANVSEIIMPDMPRMGMRRSLMSRKRNTTPANSSTSPRQEAWTRIVRTSPAPVTSTTTTSTSSPHSNQANSTSAGPLEPLRQAGQPISSGVVEAGPTSPPAIKLNESSTTTSTPQSVALEAQKTVNVTQIQQQASADNGTATSAPLQAFNSEPQPTTTTVAPRRVSNQFDLNRANRRSLLRGARSYAASLHGEPDDHSEAAGASDPMLMAETQEVATSISSTNGQESVRIKNEEPNKFQKRVSPAIESDSNSRQQEKPQPLASSDRLAPSGGGGRSQANLFGGSNWSARLRAGMSNQLEAASVVKNSSKKYDPNEDLKKLVEKIARIEFIGRPDEAIGVENEQQLRKAKKRRQGNLRGGATGSRRHELDATDDGASIGNGDIPRRQRIAAAAAAAASQAEQISVIQQTVANVTTTTVLPPSGQGSLSSASIAAPTTSAPLGANNSTTLPQPKAEAISSSAQSSDTLAATNALRLVDNQTVASLGDAKRLDGMLKPVLRPVLSAATNGSHQMSQSSSISFSVTVSPEIENQWNKLKPINVSTGGRLGQILSSSTGHKDHHLSAASGDSQPRANLGNTSSEQSAPLPQPLSQPLVDVRVDSHGHIHVRNNQSITVHVDIEPPRKSPHNMPANSNNSSSSESLDPPPTTSNTRGGDPLKPLQLSGQPKRITSRDTSASMATMFGPDDIQRVKSVSSTSSGANQPPAPRQLVPEASSNQQVLGVNTREASGELSGTSGKEMINSLRLMRKPRMLCIEVENNDSNLLYQKGVEPTMTKFTPEV